MDILWIKGETELDKKYYKCVDLINELLEDCDDFGCDEPCVLFQMKGEWFFYDYLLKRDLDNNLEEANVNNPDENVLFTNIFTALSIFIEQNSKFERGKIAYKLITARNIAELTQEELAHKLGIDAKNYAKWETGERTPKLENILKIADACNIDLKYFINK